MEARDDVNNNKCSYSPPQAPIFLNCFPPYSEPWGENKVFSSHFLDPGGKVQKPLSPLMGGK